jgi:cobalt/nickel transport system permease protein
MQFNAPKNLLRNHNHGKKILDIEQLAINSGLAYINPELKILIGIISLILCLLSKNGITAIIVMLIMIYITMHYGKIKKCDYWHISSIPLSFILLSGIVLLVDLSSCEMGYLAIPVFSKYIIVTHENIEITAMVTVKAISGVSCLYMINLSTPLYEIIGVLRRFGVPSIMIEMMYLMYRFIFILLETYQNMKTAAHTRLGFINIRRSYASFFGICTNLLIIAFQKASRSFDAMEARCFDGQLTFIEEKKTVTMKQVCLTVIYLMAMLIILVLERFY